MIFHTNEEIYYPKIYQKQNLHYDNTISHSQLKLTFQLSSCPILTLKIAHGSISIPNSSL